MMCQPAPIAAGDFPYALTLTEQEVERFKRALAEVLTGDDEPNYRVLREMYVRLRRATRRIT